MNNHDTLIEQLCREAHPVKRPATPWLRAAGWMLVALPCGFLTSLTMHRGTADWSSPGALWAGLWILASFCLGALAITTAFSLSIAGYRMAHRRWVIVCSVVWLLIGLIDATMSPDPVGRFGDGQYCYTFMMIAGAPMVVIAIAALRRTRSLRPTSSLAIAGLGIAATSQILLGFCHPVAGELIDLSMHLAAAITLVAATVIGGRRWVRI
ncbi:NrsF family protein [Undibacterium terreum]|uniref:DUF1109 domain-containing protein n=1 Tax=Undibacterium terreum TaxID=1224302 RepID=A0A916V0E5_9BURK|nr:NrsF family protein [Undibacterium terreum]GGD00464.1 hypothetical protein GCM10011396_55030 [Undibacterium terreum]